MQCQVMLKWKTYALIPAVKQLFFDSNGMATINKMKNQDNCRI